MGIQKRKIWAGTIISLLLSIVAVHPAIAESPSEPEATQLHSGTNTLKPVTGTITSIIDELVTLETRSGTTQQISIKREDISRLDLQRGMYIAALLDSRNTARNVSIIKDNIASRAITSTDSRRGGDTISGEEQVIPQRGEDKLPSLDATKKLSRE